MAPCEARRGEGGVGGGGAGAGERGLLLTSIVDARVDVLAVAGAVKRAHRVSVQLQRTTPVHVLVRPVTTTA